MASTKVARTQLQVGRWLRTQGYSLEHETAKAFKRAGFQTRIARPYRDPVEGKVREIDVLATPTFDSVLALGTTTGVSLKVAAECKNRTVGAWLIRTTAMFQLTGREWWPIGSPKLLEYLKSVDAVLTGPGSTFDNPIGFAVVEAAPNEGDANGAYKAISQAISGAVAIANEAADAAIIHPLRVVNTPMFTVNYDDDLPAVVAPVDRYRVLWSSPLLEKPTAIDLISRAKLDENLLALRARLADYYIEQGRPPTPFGAAV